MVIERERRARFVFHISILNLSLQSLYMWNLFGHPSLEGIKTILILQCKLLDQDFFKKRNGKTIKYRLIEK